VKLAQSKNDGGSPHREPASAKRKIAAIVSAVLWTLSFFLAFVISPKSPYIWMPDTLLLIGFAPLLFIWVPAWPWFVFGVFNLFIGFVLEVAKFLPDKSLPGEMPRIRQHLADYHVPIAWMLVGLASIIYGLARVGRSWIRWLMARRSRL